MVFKSSVGVPKLATLLKSSMRAFALLYFVAHIDKGELVGVEILVAKSELDLEQLVFDSLMNINLVYRC